MTILQEYEAYLRHFAETTPLGEFAQSPDSSGLALRHDVDHDIDVALEMARLEYDRGFRATYFVLHTAPYWHDPRLMDKLLQLQDYRHEVGLHVNVLSEWMRGEADDPAGRLHDLLSPLREAGVRITGMAAQGDRLCYTAGYINYWLFSELRPDNPRRSEDGRTAEGPYDPVGGKSIRYPAGDEIGRDDGARLPLWSISMRELGLAYDAWHLPMDGYFSDSGGSWTRTPDPLQSDLRRGRHQVLVHPIHWIGPPRTYFFLAAARSGSKWLAHFLDEATPLVARHEYMLNHDFHDGELAHKRTANEFAALAEDREKATGLIAEAWTRRENIKSDYAEVNVYLEPFTDIVKTYFPDATFVMLQRNPQAVVRSLLTRGWYDSPMDPQHRRVDVPDWDESGQFARVCHYVADTNRRLSEACPHSFRLEDVTKSRRALTRTLEEIGIVVHPRLAARVHSEVVNATARHRFPSFRNWSAAQHATFDRICGPLAREQGYGDWTSRLRLWLSRLVSMLKTKPRQASASPAGEVELVSGDVPPGSDGWLLSGFVLAEEQGRATVLLPDPAKAGSHRHCILGGSKWGGGSAEVDGSETGWANIPHTFLAGGIRADISDDGQLTLFALCFDGAGDIMYRRQLGVLSAMRGDVKFACRLRPDVARFDVALYASRNSVPSRTEIDRVWITLKPLSQGYAALR